MLEVTLEDDVACGILKFDPSISRKELIQFVIELATSEDAEQYIDLHIRTNGSDGRHCIGFQYRYAGKKAYESFFHKIRDKLYRRFGMGFKGWDVTSSVWKVVRS